MIYFWSDTHFNHAGIIRYCSRPYESVYEMNSGLTERWNSTVGPKDTIYLLGDFAFSAKGEESPEEIFGRLNGHKHLIVGNHDEKNSAVLKLPWESVDKLRVVKAEGARVVVCHYALETWPSAHHGYIHLHGHSHGTLKRQIPHRFDVGADVEWNPRSLEHYLLRAAEQTFDAADHHGDL